MSTQSFWMDTEGYNSGRPRLNVHFKEHTPHWRVWAYKGYAHADIRFNDVLKNVSFDIVEGFESDKGRDVNKRTMVTFEEPAARELYAQLGAMLGLTPEQST